MYFNIAIFLLNFLICFSQANPNHPLCNLNNQNVTLLSTLNGFIQGSCYNVTINYANNSKSYNNLVLTWFSVPYAEPPVGANRFKSPIPIKSWNTTRDGKNWSKTCVQPPFVNQATSSEDCLYLNIYSPYESYIKSVVQNNQSSRLPIFIWIHGGRFIFGSASENGFDGSLLSVFSNVVVVTINYRLGPFGFLHIKDTDAKGNQAFFDQNLALKWVYDNANKFGGDQNRITLGGESAGSWSTGYHLLFKQSWPYFRNAILESGNPVNIGDGTLLLTSEKSTSISFKIGTAVGCNNSNSNQELLSCLQSLDYNLINREGHFKFTYPAITYDSSFIDKHPKSLFENGDFKKCNIITGSNSFEDIVLAQIDQTKTVKLVYGNFTAFKQTLKTRLLTDDSTLNKILSLYLPFYKYNDYTTNYFIYFLDIISDYQYKCPSNQLAEYVSKYDKVAYAYFYTHRISNSNMPSVDGAAHGEEIPMVFGQPLLDNSTFPAYEKAFSEQIIKYWSDFIKNDKMDLSWSKYKSGFIGRNVLNLKANNINNNLIFPFIDFKCKFWNTFIRLA